MKPLHLHPDRLFPAETRTRDMARALYATVDLDEQVPSEHFKAVAQVIGYVMRLTGKIKPN